jgi:anthranilate phosphoribosyltransferase
LKRARAAIESGDALRKVEQFVAVTQSLGRAN